MFRLTCSRFQRRLYSAPLTPGRRSGHLPSVLAGRLPSYVQRLQHAPLDGLKDNGVCCYTIHVRIEICDSLACFCRRAGYRSRARPPSSLNVIINEFLIEYVEKSLQVTFRRVHGFPNGKQLAMVNPPIIDNDASNLHLLVVNRFGARENPWQSKRAPPGTKSRSPSRSL